jgi:hypothetical protein
VAPFVSRRSFEAVTGPKREWWLVLTVSSQLAVVGIVLAVAAQRGSVGAEMKLLGAGSAGALAAIDVVYVARGRISPAYLVDAVLEFGLIGGWLACRRTREGRAR